VLAEAFRTWIVASVMPERAHHAEFRLRDQVLEHVFSRLGGRPVQAKMTRRMAHGVHFEIFEADFLHLPTGGMIDDIVDIVTKTISALKRRRVAVDKTGKGVETAAGNAAKIFEVSLKVTVCLGRHIETERRPKAWVDVVEVHSSAIGRDVTSGVGRSFRRFTDRARNK
jgi:hypothetical protein